MTDAKLSDFSGDQDFDPDQPDSAKPFEAVGVDQLPSGLPRAALDAVAEFGARTGIALDVSSFVPSRAALRAWYGYSMGEPVIGFVTRRGVGEVRLNGVPGLLVAEVTSMDDESADEALADAPLDVYFVAFATASEAERVALVRTPGFPLPLQRVAKCAE